MKNYFHYFEICTYFYSIFQNQKVFYFATFFLNLKRINICSFLFMTIIITIHFLIWITKLNFILVIFIRIQSYSCSYILNWGVSYILNFMIINSQLRIYIFITLLILLILCLFIIFIYNDFLVIRIKNVLIIRNFIFFVNFWVLKLFQLFFSFFWWFYNKTILLLVFFIQFFFLEIHISIFFIFLYNFFN